MKRNKGNKYENEEERKKNEKLKMNKINHREIEKE